MLRHLPSEKRVLLRQSRAELGEHKGTMEWGLRSRGGQGRVLGSCHAVSTAFAKKVQTDNRDFICQLR